MVLNLFRNKVLILLFILLSILNCKYSQVLSTKDCNIFDYLNVFIEGSNKLAKENYIIIITLQHSEEPDLYFLNIQNSPKALLKYNDLTLENLGTTSYKGYDVVLFSGINSSIQENLICLNLKNILIKTETNEIILNDNPVLWNFYVDKNLNYFKPQFEQETKYDSIFKALKSVKQIPSE